MRSLMKHSHLFGKNPNEVQAITQGRILQICFCKAKTNRYLFISNEFLKCIIHMWIQLYRIFQ